MKKTKQTAKQHSFLEKDHESSIGRSKRLYFSSTYAFLKKFLKTYCNSKKYVPVLEEFKKTNENVFIHLLTDNALSPEQFRFLMSDSEVFTYKLLCGESWFDQSTLQYLYQNGLLLDRELFSSFRSFQEVAHKLYSLRGQMKSLSIFKLYEKELIESFRKSNNIWFLFLNTDCFVQVLTRKLYTFREIIDLCVEQRQFRTFLKNNLIFSKCESKQLLHDKDYSYVYQKVLENSEIQSLAYSKQLTSQILKRNLESFEELLLKLKKVDKLAVFLTDCLVTNDAQCFCIFKNLTSTNEFMSLSLNTDVIQYILENFLIDLSSSTILDDLSKKAFLSKYGCSTNYDDFFSYWKMNTRNTTLIKLCELNQLLSGCTKLSSHEKKTIAKIIECNEKAKTTLNQIINNKIESTYNFSSLKELITKDDKKKKLQLNF